METHLALFITILVTFTASYFISRIWDIHIDLTIIVMSLLIANGMSDVNPGLVLFSFAIITILIIISIILYSSHLKNIRIWHSNINDKKVYYWSMFNYLSSVAIANITFIFGYSVSMKKETLNISYEDQVGGFEDLIDAITDPILSNIYWYILFGCIFTILVGVRALMVYNTKQDS